MSKVIYLVRHSVRFDYSNVLDYKTDQSFMLKSEKIILSTKGEKRAEVLSSLEELNNLDAVYTSNCVRTLSTAKYLLEKQNLDVTIDDRFDERRVGVFNSDSVPDWYERQYYDIDYKTVGGESQRDVRKRFEQAFDEILNNKKLKRVAIFSHGYAITMFLMKYLELVDVKYNAYFKFKYKNKVIFDGILEMPDLFKLEFNNKNELTNISHIDMEDIWKI
ncbi:MAG: histidine phosphatase family protein [Bacilli bacterium]|nr:histidine phosphatase family protein [Bacilli bacterium]